MKVHQLAEKLDAQARRLDKAGITADNGNRIVLNDFCIETHAGEIIVPRSTGGPGIHVVAIPCGKFLKADADGELIFEATGTGELYEIEAHYETRLIERVRVVAGLCDAPPEPEPIKQIEVRDAVPLTDAGVTAAATKGSSASNLSEADRAFIAGDMERYNRLRGFTKDDEPAPRSGVKSMLKRLASEWGLGE